MMRFYASCVSRLDAAYSDRAYFVALKARLFAGICSLGVLFIAINVAKLWWVHPGFLGPRLVVNAVLGSACLGGLLAVYRGEIQRAANAMALAIFVVVQSVFWMNWASTVSVQPLAAAYQLYAFGIVLLLFAMVFAGRKVALFIFGGTLVSHAAIYFVALNHAELTAPTRLAADVLLRDGFLVEVFLFFLGVTLIRMVEAANRRSEDTLWHTRRLNQNLEQLVSEKEKELKTAVNQAEEAARAESTFLANMSHEIRTPLHGVIATSDLVLHRENLDPAVREQVELISESGELLLKVLSDLLDLSKLEAGQLVIERRGFDVVATVKEAAAGMASSAVAGALKLEVSIDPQVTGQFEGDSGRLRQVLANLLSNAVKFTPSGGNVSVRVKAAGTREGQHLIRFEVADTGIGMDAVTTARVFERFVQADDSTTRMFGGSGLGLAISRRLVEMMGGELEVQSALGSGSTFFFTIGFKRVTAEAMSQAGAAGKKVGLNRRVLVVEDNPVNRKIIATQLAQLGCVYQVVEDGESALKALWEEPHPDVILMDCHMPKMDGWETTRRIRAMQQSALATEKKAARIPVIALTAADLLEDRQRSEAAGMDGFLSKPIKVDALRKVLESPPRRA